MKSWIKYLIQTSTLTVVMSFITACNSTSQAQHLRNHCASETLILSLPGVRKELGINDQQAALLDELRYSFTTQLKNLSAIGADGDDGALRSEWDTRTLNKQYNRRALAILSCSQRQRLFEIERQMIGASLLGSPYEQNLLGLSAQQQSQLNALNSSSQAQVLSLKSQVDAGQISSFSKDLALQRIHGTVSRQMYAILTPEQKKTWKIISGQKCEFPEIHDPNARTMSLFEGY